MVVNDSNQEDDTTQNVDLDALRALANAAVAADSDIPSGHTSYVPAASLCAPSAGLTAVPADSPYVPAGVSSKGKSPMVKEDIPVKERTFRQMEEDRLGEEAAKRLHEEEKAKM
nr:SGNH hydrolase-type esterase domain-containing protein [Tanacetum cinerariifolium]